MIGPLINHQAPKIRKKKGWEDKEEKERGKDEEEAWEIESFKERNPEWRSASDSLKGERRAARRAERQRWGRSSNKRLAGGEIKPWDLWVERDWTLQSPLKVQLLHLSPEPGCFRWGLSAFCYRVIVKQLADPCWVANVLHFLSGWLLLSESVSLVHTLVGDQVSSVIKWKHT